MADIHFVKEQSFSNLCKTRVLVMPLRIYCTLSLMKILHIWIHFIVVFFDLFLSVSI